MKAIVSQIETECLTFSAGMLHAFARLYIVPELMHTKVPVGIGFWSNTTLT